MSPENFQYRTTPLFEIGSPESEDGLYPTQSQRFGTSSLETEVPPQTIISLPVQTAV